MPFQVSSRLQARSAVFEGVEVQWGGVGGDQGTVQLEFEARCRASGDDLAERLLHEDQAALAQFGVIGRFGCEDLPGAVEQLGAVVGSWVVLGCAQALGVVELAFEAGDLGVDELEGFL